jgi:putative transcriptional regulator
MECLAEIEAGRAKPALIPVPPEIDVRAIRKRFALSQEAFALRFVFKKGTVRDWEQKLRMPEASARLLLTVIPKEPDAVMRALEAA